jgi:carbonic anhydrase/acetyltransferase-like protein (isoleucine patch superfamily)
VKLHTDAVNVHPRAWVAPGAVLAGEVSVGEAASIWYGCVLRGDLEPITIGAGTNVQDLTLVHVDLDQPTVIGERVTIGHRCIVHGCAIEDEALIGMGAVLLSGCRIGKGALVAAGAVVLEGMEVPPGSVAAGVPAKIRGEVSPAMRERFLAGVGHYRQLAEEYRSGRLGAGPRGGTWSAGGRA